MAFIGSLAFGVLHCEDFGMFPYIICLLQSKVEVSADITVVEDFQHLRIIWECDRHRLYIPVSTCELEC